MEAGPDSGEYSYVLHRQPACRHCRMPSLFPVSLFEPTLFIFIHGRFRAQAFNFFFYKSLHILYFVFK